MHLILEILQYIKAKEAHHQYIWVRSRRHGCLVTWFCYQMIAKPGNKTAAPSWPDPYTAKFSVSSCWPLHPCPPQVNGQSINASQPATNGSSAAAAAAVATVSSSSLNLNSALQAPTVAQPVPALSSQLITSVTPQVISAVSNAQTLASGLTASTTNINQLLPRMYLGNIMKRLTLLIPKMTYKHDIQHLMTDIVKY